jgi:hypothetical protein
MTADPEGCYGCHCLSGRRFRHDSYFIDSRTGHRFCLECIAALVSWELDGCPEPDEVSYPDWINEEAVS